MKLLILALTVSAVYASTFQVGLNFKPSQDKRQLYGSKLLHHVQMSRIFPDSKTFVDMHMKRDEKAILNAFDELLAKTNERPTKEQLADFISYNFDSESGLESWRPSDFVSEPGFLNSIQDSQLKQFARDVYSILPTLGRKIKPVVFKNPEQFSMIPVHNGFIVPGGNFKEFNYMESYWIIESLLISGMKETAKGMISNFIELQREFGYIPSGDRYYYLGRSQPPLLSAMMAIYLQETNDIEFLRANIDAIEGELEYWLDTHSVVFDVAGREYSLLRYITQCRGPRPEEYYQDFTNAQVFDNEQRQEQFYTDMKAAAESGWVISSRWIINKNGSNFGDLSWMHTTDIVPVDLNAIFASAVQNLAQFYSVLNDEHIASRGAHWLEIGKTWINSIEEVLWNEKVGMWFDWDLSSSQHRKYFYTSNLSPLWMGVVKPEFIKAKSQLILNYLRRTHSLEYPGGVPASLTKSGYLYDLPYAYPAQVSIVVSSLEALQTEEASKMAFEVAQNLVRSIYKAYQTNKQLYAYYDVETPGKPFIASGEYFNKEEAFGGTIGVIIEMLAKYGATMTSVRGFLPFPSKFGQYSQFYSTSAPQIANYQYSTFPAKPFVSVAKPESPIKPVYTNEYKKPSVAPTYFAQTTYLSSELTKPTLAEVQPEHIVSVEKKPEVTTLKDEEYISTTYKPEYITSAPIKPYQPIQTEDKVEAVPVYNKPSYTTFVLQKPTLVTEVKPEVVPTNPVYTSFGSKPQYFASVRPTYVAPAKPVPTLPTNKFELPVSKPTYVAPQPLKHEYVSVEAKPEPQHLEKKPEYLSVSPVPQKPEYLSVEAKPEQQLLEKNPEYLPVAPTPLKPEPELIKKNPEYLAIAPFSQKPVAPVPQKPEYLPVAPVPQKPELLPVAPEPQKPAYLPVTPVPQKPAYLPVAPVPQKPAYLPVAPVPQKPAYLPVAPVPQKPEYLPLAPVPQKPLYVSVQTKPESEVLNKKPEYVSVVGAKPEVVPTAYPAKPSYTSSIVSKPEYVSVQAKPESVLIEKKPEYVPAPEVKPEVVATVYNKPLYPTPAPVKPAFVIEPKPQVDLPVAPVPQKPGYLPVAPVPQKPEYLPLAPVPQKPLYVSVQTKPESEVLNKKPEYVSVVEAKPEVVPTAYPAKPSYTSSIVSKPEYVSVQAKPESVLIEKKSEYVPAAEVKPEVVATFYNKPLYPTPAPVKPAFVIEPKPQVDLPVAPVPQKPGYLPVAPVPQKPEYLPLAPVPQKPLYVSVQTKPESEVLNKKPEYVSVVEAKPEVVPTAYPAKPSYTSSIVSKPEYVSVQAKPESVLIEKKPEYVPAPEVKPEVVATVYNKPLYSTPAPVKPAFVIEPKPQVAPTRYPAQPLYPKPVQTSYVAPLSLKHEYISVEAKPESQLPEKKPEYVTEEIISATTLEPEYVSTTAQPEQVTLIPAKPEQVTVYPAKPEQVTLYPAKPTQVFYPAKPAQVSLYPAKPTFSSFPSWPKYTTSVKVPFVSAVKPLNNVQAKPEYISTTEFKQEEVATTFAPKYEATTTSKPEPQYPAMPAYVASLPIKHEYVHSEASLPAKEVVIQTFPVKPVYGSQQTVYVSSPKPFFAPTKSSLVAAVPLQAQQVSYTSSSYRQPGNSVPAISESKYTTSYPSTIEYESSTVAEPEYTTAAGEYTTYKPEYTTVAEPEYTTLHSQFEYTTTESQLDATVKPQHVYVSVQSKPQAAAVAIGGSASTEKKPYFAGYSTISSQKQEVPKVQTTYISSVQSQASDLAELTPVVSVSIPAKQGQIASQDQATVLQQSHFSYFDKPAPVVVATQPPKPEGFTSFTKLNVNSGSASKVESGSTNTVVSSKPQFSFGTFSSGYVFNKTVTPSSVTSTVNVTGVTKNNQKWPQTGQYVSSSSWQGSNYNNNKPFSYYSSYKPNRWNSYPGQYQGQYQTGQYQSGQYKGQYQGQYNTGLYRPTVSSTTFKPLFSSSTVKSVPGNVISALG